ncbi:Serpentine receptor class gamma [Caenorhabditis elegans]|uniref:Serpentine receptor class gamma n=1 Tax=Caenorhabditis elegans TaxID=6239 RepID=Q18818_CAEEL|nr:Serpentine receptor class gamma [Caenorhabditis elegans]CAB00855.2 Serpentine receptor class gamma [Caenorhabditis elegans]|eukprot:NP_001254876.1 Uncharacterized protein CELE_C54C6.4 [Caenorhabditis elegans]
MCSDLIASISRSLSLLSTLLLVISYLGILIYISRLSKKYHLFFRIFYMSMIFTRSLPPLVRSIGYFIALFCDYSVPPFVFTALLLAKFFSRAAGFCCIFERTFATFYAKGYENSKRYFFVIICVLVCAGFSGITLAVDADSDFGQKYSSLSYGVFCIVTTTMLFFVNRSLVKKSSASKCNLSERYQLTENIKALRLFLPFSMAISGNSMVLSMSMLLFHIDTVFNFPICQKVPSYAPIFLCIIFTTTIINLAAPLYVFYHNRKTRMLQKIGVAEIRNVLGVNIVGNGMGNDEQYFQHYKTAWA